MASHPMLCCHLENSMSWFQSYVSHCRVMPLSEFNGMSSQSHVSHCRVLLLGEFTVMIPERHATLQGVIIPSAILKIVFAIFYFLFLMQFGLWRAATFVSSAIHLFHDRHARANMALRDKQDWAEPRTWVPWKAMNRTPQGRVRSCWNAAGSKHTRTSQSERTRTSPLQTHDAFIVLLLCVERVMFVWCLSGDRPGWRGHNVQWLHTSRPRDGVSLQPSLG